MDFQFASPWALALLAALPLLWFAPRQRARQMKPATVRFSSTDPLRKAQQQTRRSWRMALQPLLPTLRLLAAGALIVGLARPQFVQAREIVHGEGVDIALALDISGSMASLDFEPRNRLEAAKEVIHEFVGQRTYDRIGLVVFAGNAFNQSPPTVDHNVLRRMLDQAHLATELGVEDGTALGMGLANAANMLKDSDAASKVVILLTDGVNNAGQIDPRTAADAAAQLGIKVYTIGMGRTGEVPVPVVDAFGRERVVLQQSTLDEATLQAIADATNGRYFRAEDTASLREIYAAIDALEASQIEIETYANHRELVGWALIPGLLLLLSETVLRQTALRSIP